MTAVAAEMLAATVDRAREALREAPPEDVAEIAATRTSTATRERLDRLRDRRARAIVQ